jgi:hypothetical protein
LIHVHGAGGEHGIDIEGQRRFRRVRAGHPGAQVGGAELDIGVRPLADYVGDTVAEIRGWEKRRCVRVIGERPLVRETMPRTQRTATSN